MDPYVAQTPLWPFIVYFFACLLLVASMIGASYVLGQRHRGVATGEPYESGIPPTGSAHIRLSVKYYMMAMFFVIFDLEALFVFAWAVALREVGWPGYIEICIFIAVLLSALAYLWRLGALEWGTRRRKGSTYY